MELNHFLNTLESSPDTIAFTDTIALIDALYNFNPTAFTNGATRNEAGQNNGSCKLFAFAKRQGLTQAQTLACFGDYYRTDVLGNPDGSDHQNIRNFITHGWDGVRFDGEALTPKT